MANRVMDILYGTGNREVGVINSAFAKEYVNGARLTVADLDNYLLVEFVGYDADGVKTIKPLTDNTKVGHIISTVEEEDLYRANDAGLPANYVDFYNKAGDMCKVTLSEPWLRYETSAYSLNAGVTAPQKGHLAYYDITTKKYIVCDGASLPAAYNTAANKYEVVEANSDFGFNIGKATIRLMRI